MKKILAMAMALVMMMLVAVPAFATKSFDNTTDVVADPTKNQTVVKTDISNAGVGEYTVTIPAEISIVWKSTDAVDKTFDVDTQLVTDYQLKVDVVKTSNMKNAKGVELPYNLTGDGTEASIMQAARATTTYNFSVQVPDWSQVTVDNYSGAITFKAEVVAPSVEG